MRQKLHGRSFLKLLDFATAELSFLLRLGTSLKKAKVTGTEQRLLKWKNIAMIVKNDSTRLRSAIEVVAFDQVEYVTNLRRSGSYIGTKETMMDTVHVLGRFL